MGGICTSTEIAKQCSDSVAKRYINLKRAGILQNGLQNLSGVNILSERSFI